MINERHTFQRNMHQTPSWRKIFVSSFLFLYSCFSLFLYYGIHFFLLYLLNCFYNLNFWRGVFFLFFVFCFWVQSFSFTTIKFGLLVLVLFVLCRFWFLFFVGFGFGFGSFTRAWRMGKKLEQIKHRFYWRSTPNSRIYL